jgi:IclR family transcriptional regulator, acetate operon repressor
MSSVNRALDILETLANEGTTLSLKDIAERSGITRPTAHRLLQTLVERGYVEQDNMREYAVGRAALALAGGMLSRLEPARAARPALEHLRQLTPETIHFAVLAGTDAVYVDKIDGRRAYRMASEVGHHLSLHCTAIGKSILAFLPEERRAEILRETGLPRRTPNTITKPELLDVELADVRRRGFAIDDEENENEIRCVGASVFNARGEPFAAVSVSAPSFQFSRDAALMLAPALVDTAREISLAVGAPIDVVPYVRQGRDADGEEAANRR